MLDLSRTAGEGVYRLGTGALTLRVGSAPKRPLFRLAERINPKRAFLFVSTVLSRHVPVRPSEHLEAVGALVRRCAPETLSGPVLVVGYAETAVGLGAAVARGLARSAPSSDLLYLSTTRHPVPEREWVRFSEGQSHATDDHVLRPDPHPAISEAGSALVLVDDETTTGATFAALTAALMEGGLRPSRVLLVTLTDWSDGAAEASVSRLLPKAEVRSVSLLKGVWSWAPDPGLARPALPVDAPAAYPLWVPSRRVAPRDGVRDWSYDQLHGVADRLASKPGERVLVIGTGEHVWEPMLMGEALESRGGDVRVVATTRSPILPGAAIRHKLTFPDHFGLGVPMYLHNVPRRPDARYLDLFEEACVPGVPRLARDVRALSGQILDRIRSGELSSQVTLCSLVRAGVPYGVLLLRDLERAGADVTHFGVSIIRDRGLDEVGMRRVLSERPADGVVFVDGWTGKGAITPELERSWRKISGRDPLLAVIADPCGRAGLCASREDWLIPSGILGENVSGLISLSILRPDLTSPDAYHGYVPLDHLAGIDLSRDFVDRVEVSRSGLERTITRAS